MIGVTTTAIYDWANDPSGKPSNLAFSPGAFTSLPNKLNFLERLQNVLQKKYMDEYFGPGYLSIYEISTEFSLVFVNSHYSVNGIKPFIPGILEADCLHVEDKKEDLVLRKEDDENNNSLT
ncbi:uncharacterized protein LOC117170081 [Belonocnema kinseyi]|uniref:uncharacterized protein LOC117170081 n=1 Tax=Belonocnema kinseyi TaxID=2817044 RepID=UPI00143DCE67|nr:uncharacterized protein LOC117170081 [Belonocnema kinseyi]